MEGKLDRQCCVHQLQFRQPRNADGIVSKMEKKNLTTGFSYKFQAPYRLKSQQPWEHRLAGDPQAAIIQKTLSSEAGREKASSSAPSRFL